MWANRSGRSPKMSDHERFAQVAQRKWAIVSESLRSLTKNERMSELLIFFSKSLICSFLDKKRALRAEIKWANSQPCLHPSKLTNFSELAWGCPAAWSPDPSGPPPPDSPLPSEGTLEEGHSRPSLIATCRTSTIFFLSLLKNRNMLPDTLWVMEGWCCTWWMAP